MGINCYSVVCNTAKVRFFKQITTFSWSFSWLPTLFAIQQKYDFSSKSQQHCGVAVFGLSCLQYSKSTIFQANHNKWCYDKNQHKVVCNTAKVRFFKQITTSIWRPWWTSVLFAIQQKYDFSSKSQRWWECCSCSCSCLQYSKSTIFQANHNKFSLQTLCSEVVCNTAKVRFFKQITTYCCTARNSR